MRLTSRTHHILAVLGTLLLLLRSGVSQSDSVSQSPNQMAVQEGQSVILHCNFSTLGTNLYLFWYRQYVDGEPQSILSAYKNREQKNSFSKGKFSTTLFVENKTVPLKIEGVSLQDGAVYYCALSSDGTYKQIFGTGTRLLVLPNLEDSGPSLYKLKPQKGENENINACLITDYSPGNISAGLGDTLEQVNSSLVITDDGPSYGTVLWGSTNGKFNCVADYKGQKFNDTKDDDGTCRAEFETDERLNFLSLTVLGLRIIFLKTVAINLLLTFRLWSC